MIWEDYRDLGVVVWGISSEDRYAGLVGFTDQMGFTYPVLFDDGGLARPIQSGRHSHQQPVSAGLDHRRRWSGSVCEHHL